MTAQSFADLLHKGKWDSSSLNEATTMVTFLKAIGIPRLDLMREFFSRDGDTRDAVDGALVDMLAAAGGDVNRLSQANHYLDYLEKDPGLPKVIEERLDGIRRAQENLDLGNRVEELVKRNLEGEGFIVHRTGVGSDFEIASTETDDLARLELRHSERTWLVEVNPSLPAILTSSFISTGCVSKNPRMALQTRHNRFFPALRRSSSACRRPTIRCRAHRGSPAASAPAASPCAHARICHRRT